MRWGIHTGKVGTWPEKTGLGEAAKTSRKIPIGSASTGCGLDWGQGRNMWSVHDMLGAILSERTWYYECLWWKISGLSKQPFADLNVAYPLEIPHPRPELVPLFIQRPGRNAWDDKRESTGIHLPGVRVLKVLPSKEVLANLIRELRQEPPLIYSKLKLDIHLKTSGNQNKNEGDFVYLNYENNFLNSPIPLTRVDLAWVYQYPWWLI